MRQRSMSGRSGRRMSAICRSRRFGWHLCLRIRGCQPRCSLAWALPLCIHRRNMSGRLGKRMSAICCSRRRGWRSSPRRREGRRPCIHSRPAHRIRICRWCIHSLWRMARAARRHCNRSAWRSCLRRPASPLRCIPAGFQRVLPGRRRSRRPGSTDTRASPTSRSRMSGLHLGRRRPACQRPSIRAHKACQAEAARMRRWCTRCRLGRTRSAICRLCRMRMCLCRCRHWDRWRGSRRLTASSALPCRPTFRIPCRKGWIINCIFS